MHKKVYIRFSWVCKIFCYFIALFIFIFYVYISNWMNQSRIFVYTMATGSYIVQIADAVWMKIYNQLIVHRKPLY